MKRFSVLLLQIIIMLCFLILPLIFLFSTYSNHVMTIARQESAKVAQSSLSNVHTILSMLAHNANAEATRIASTPKSLESVANISDYEHIVQDIDVQVALRDVTDRLVTAQYADNRLRNIYLYALGSNYIITSDRGILRADGFEDISWLPRYQAAAARQSIARTSLWDVRVIPAIDLIKYGADDGELPVISFLYGVSFPRNTKTRCVLVMNYYLSEISSIINEGIQPLGGNLILVDRQGIAISHPDLIRLGEDLSYESFVQYAIRSTQDSGYYLDEPNNAGLFSIYDPDQAIHAYHKAGLNDWIIISTFPMQTLTARSGQITQRYLLYMLILVSIASALCILALRLLHRPVARLAREVHTSVAEPVRNEYALIRNAFKTMQTEEARLHALIEQSGDDRRSLYLLSLCRGTKWEGPPPVQWPHQAFCVAVLCLDHREAFINKTTREERAYYRMLLIDQSEALLSEKTFARGTVIDAYTVALVIATPLDAEGTMLAVVSALETLQQDVREELPFTFSAGIGARTTTLDGIMASHQQAQDALKQRLIHGAGSITGWHDSLRQHGEYYYPVDVEHRLLNGLAASNPDCTLDALAALPGELGYLPAENIVQVYNQLLSAMVSQLLREGYAIHSILGGVQSWYQLISNAETLEDLTDVMEMLCREIIAGLRIENAQQDAHLPRILKYIALHYQEDIDFEEMANEMGISYSYMRRIMREQRGKTLLDTVHGLRIEQAKLLLTDTTLAIRSIAEQIGYKNTQSFERFFRKFEGISASEYRCSRK